MFDLAINQYLACTAIVSDLLVACASALLCVDSSPLSPCSSYARQSHSRHFRSYARSYRQNFRSTSQEGNQFAIQDDSGIKWTNVEELGIGAEAGSGSAGTSRSSGMSLRTCASWSASQEGLGMTSNPKTQQLERNAGQIN